MSEKKNLLQWAWDGIKSYASYASDFRRSSTLPSPPSLTQQHVPPTLETNSSNLSRTYQSPLPYGSPFLTSPVGKASAKASAKVAAEATAAKAMETFVQSSKEMVPSVQSFEHTGTCPAGTDMSSGTCALGVPLTIAGLVTMGTIIMGYFTRNPQYITSSMDFIKRQTGFESKISDISPQLPEIMLNDIFENIGETHDYTKINSVYLNKLK